jgi:hypothetical protein
MLDIFARGQQTAKKWSDDMNLQDMPKQRGGEYEGVDPDYIKIRDSRRFSRPRTIFADPEGKVRIGRVHVPLDTKNIQINGLVYEVKFNPHGQRGTIYYLDIGPHDPAWYRFYAACKCRRRAEDAPNFTGNTAEF